MECTRSSRRCQLLKSLIMRWSRRPSLIMVSSTSFSQNCFQIHYYYLFFFSLWIKHIPFKVRTTWIDRSCLDSKLFSVSARMVSCLYWFMIQFKQFRRRNQFKWWQLARAEKSFALDSSRFRNGQECYGGAGRTKHSFCNWDSFCRCETPYQNIWIAWRALKIRKAWTSDGQFRLVYLCYF